jgi:hypothetical protein
VPKRKTPTSVEAVNRRKNLEKEKRFHHPRETAMLTMTRGEKE